MIEITLSDHTSDQSRVATDKRQAEFEEAGRCHSAAVAARELKSANLRQASREKFAAGSYGYWFISLFPRIAHALSSAPKPPQMAAASQEEIVWNAGSEGEKRVTDALSELLSDEWVMVSGYKNRGGEIDKLLIGSTGVLAIEIKFVNGLVSCDGDRWWRDKFDKYGNLVQQNVPIADKRGRGPSAQVNDAADRLQAFLAKRSTVPRVARAVVLSHEASRLEMIQNQTVDLIATLDQLNERTVTSVVKDGLGGCSVEQVLTLVRKDHEFYERPPSTRPIRSAAKGSSRADG